MKQPVRRRAAGKRAATVHAPADLHERWARLHATDAEPFPDEQRMARLARSHPRFAATVQQCGGAARVAAGVQQAWSEFHAGQFLRAITLGSQFGAIGASAANKAAAVHSLYPGRSATNVLKVLEQATRRGEAAVESLPDYANAHFNLALVMGRYSQRISILTALAEGLASRVREHLERALALE
ncbi:MAG: hypothetical protein JSR15_07755, partial [Proteobacteria bacterium]|nr:hypothetical protein [Pseudomonadota bacterium]